MIDYVNNKKLFIGEKVKVKNEKEIGIITRIDFDFNMIYVLFKKMKEKSYPFPDALEQNIIQLITKN